MNKKNLYVLVALLTVNTAYSEITTSGQSTYTNERGAFTYYDKNGEVIPSGTQVILQLDGTTGNILSAEGETIGTAFATKQLALYAREKATMDSDAILDEAGNVIPYNEEEYQKKSFELTSLLFGASEIGNKYCRPAGSEMPKSLANWFKSIKEYKEGENGRDKILNDRLTSIKSKLTEIINQKTSKDLQVEAIQFQIDMTNVSIDSIAGTNIFKGDQNNEQTAKTGRLPLREKLLVSALKSISLNGTENIRYRETYQNRLLISGLDESLKIATDACNKTKKENKCDEKNKDVKCEDKTVSDAVEGCKEAIAKIPEIQSVPAISYMELYLIPQIPSKELNQKMLRLETKMQELMAAIPKSKDKAYDWHSPMQSGLEEMKLARKSSGALCPSSIAVGEYDSSKSSSIAPEGETIKVEGADKITESAKGFLSDLGITGEEATHSTEVFTKAWNATDLVIGQSGQREVYYKKFAMKISELIEMDRVKLYELVTLQKKLTSYLATVQSSLGAPVAPRANSLSPVAQAGADNGAKAVNAASTTVATSSSNVMHENISNQNMNPEIIFSQISGLNELTKGQLSKSTGSSTNNKALGSSFSPTSIQSGGTLSGGSAAVAKKYIAEIKRNDIKMDYVEKAATKLRANKVVNTNANTKNTIVSKVSQENSQSTYDNALNATFDKFASTSSASSVYKRAAISGIDGATPDLKTSEGTLAAPELQKANAKIAALLKVADKKVVKEVKKEKPSKKSAFRKLKNGNAVKQVYNPSTGSFDEVAVEVMPENVSVGGLDVVAAEVDSEDELILAESIMAKKAKKKDAYDAKEDDSLFTRVTKAYIRNYEKVTKKPGE